MSSNRAYLLRAFHEWILDNYCTPYLMVDAHFEGVEVPTQYINDDGTIVLNLGKTAVRDLQIGNEIVDFYARFSGVERHLVVPVRAVRAIYAQENGRGMVFGEDEPEAPPPKKSKPEPKTENKQVKIPPHLRVIK